MNVTNRFSGQRQRRVLLVAVTAGWIVATFAAVTTSGAVMAAGLAVVAVANLACSKLVLALAATESNRAAAVPMARFDEVVRRLDDATNRLAEQATSMEISIESTARLATGHQEVSARRLEALERRLKPSRRFALRTSNDLIPRELALGESLGKASIRRDAR